MTSACWLNGRARVARRGPRLTADIDCIFQVLDRGGPDRASGVVCHWRSARQTMGPCRAVASGRALLFRPIQDHSCGMWKRSVSRAGMGVVPFGDQVCRSHAWPTGPESPGVSGLVVGHGPVGDAERLLCGPPISREASPKGFTCFSGRTVSVRRAGPPTPRTRAGMKHNALPPRSLSDEGPEDRWGLYADRTSLCCAEACASTMGSDGDGTVSRVLRVLPMPRRILGLLGTGSS